MAKKLKACLNCKTIYEGTKCTNCGETPSSDTFRGFVEIFNPEKSEIADKMKIHSKGKFAIKIK
ncbi:MAG: transcription elongation factor subunit Spt4 [Nanoarchaeota archaeon]|nr:transcription elongation factor subunit Spt4 [Nanoarchaeota archaeon]